jgi:hypothetical protein
LSKSAGKSFRVPISRRGIREDEPEGPPAVTLTRGITPYTPEVGVDIIANFSLSDWSLERWLDVTTVDREQLKEVTYGCLSDNEERK